LVGLNLAAASRLASAHGYQIRDLAPGYDVRTEDLVANRLDIECSSTSPTCVVVRIVEKG
jgi:hypothetical protein